MPSISSTSDERLDDPQNKIGQFVDRSDHEPALKYFNVAERYIEAGCLFSSFSVLPGNLTSTSPFFGTPMGSMNGIVMDSSSGTAKVEEKSFPNNSSAVAGSSR